MRPGATLGVLDVTEFYGESSGGVRTYLDRKAAYVAERSHLRQVIVVPSPDDRIDDGDGVRLYGLRGPRVPMHPPYRFMLSLRQPSRIIAHERPDIIELGSPGLVPWIVRLAMRPRATPTVLFWHSHYPKLLDERDGGLLNEAAWTYARAMDRLVSMTVVASDYVARDLARAGIERVERIPLGVDLVCFDPERRGHARVTRATHGLPLDRPLVLYVGRLATEKRVDVLLRAWPAIRAKTSAHLVIVGEGPERERLATLVRDGVTWLPFQWDRERLADLMAAAELFVAPSPVETFGLAALEAMATRTPVLAADDGGVAELVHRSGGGACFRPNDAASLAEAAIALLEGAPSRTHSLGSAARAYAEREHAWERVFDRLFALYARVIAERSGR